MVTLKQIAEEAEVSVFTVSCILNNKTSKISFTEKTVQKVKAIASRHNYRKNIAASLLAKQKSGLIGVIFPATSRSFFSRILAGIQDELEKSDYNMILCLNSDKTKEYKHFEYLSNRGVDGFIIEPSGCIVDELENVKDIKTPAIVLRREAHFPYSNYLMVDDFNGGQLAAEFFLDLNHSASFLLRPEDETEKKNSTPYYKDRFAGFASIFKKNNANTIDTNLNKLIYIIKNRKTKCKAVFAASDEIAVQFYHYANKAGIKIPEDISVIGYNDDYLTDFMNPPLTTVNQPKEEFGRIAAAHIMKKISGQIIEDQILPPSLVKRESCIRYK